MAVPGAFDSAPYNTFFIEGLPGQGKTGIISSICVRLSHALGHGKVLQVALRGVVAQLTPGGQTMARVLDLGVLDGSSRNADGSVRTTTYPEARGIMRCGDFLLIDEYEELSGSKVDVSACYEAHIIFPFIVAPLVSTPYLKSTPNTGP